MGQLPSVAMAAMDVLETLSFHFGDLEIFQYYISVNNC